MPREDSRTFRIAFHSQYFHTSGIIYRVYASVAKWLWHGRQPDRRWLQQGGRHIPRVFPSSSAISTALSYNDPGRILTGGTPTERRVDRGAVSLQDRSTLTASLPLQRVIPEAGFQWGVYGDNMIAQKSSSDISSNPNEWSHSWAMIKLKIKKQPTMLTVKRCHCAGRKKTHRDRMTGSKNED